LVHTRDGQIASSVTRTPGRDGQDGTLISQTASTYDKATGRLVSTTVTSADGTSVTRSMRYDKLGRVTEVWEGTQEDGRDKTEQYKASVIGYGYDADGNTTSVTYPDGTTLTQAFDEAGRMVKSTDGAGAVTGYSYHPGTGRLERAVQKAEDGTELASAVYGYDTLGRVESVKHGNKTTTRYEYFDNDQPKSQTLTRDDGGEVLARTAYTYNSHGSLETRTDTRPGVKGDGTTDTGAGNVTTHAVHTYDAYDRLTRTVLHDGDSADGKLVKQTDYTINASGDVTHQKTTGPDGKTSETVNTIDAAGRRTAVTTDGAKAGQVWDAAGNLTTDRHGTTVTYNPDNKPVTLTPTQAGQATVAVAYWADGSRRSATTTNAEGTEQTTTYHYTPTGTLANDTTAGLTASYLTTPQGREHRTLTHNGTPAADRAGTGYLLADRRGNTTALVNHDGAVTDSYYYEDYGRPATHHATPLTPNPQADRARTNPIQYGGEYTNNWDHTQYTPARTYTPDGYFTTRDTWQLHNRHQAFNTNPTNHTDPTGHFSLRTVKKGLQYGSGAATVAGMGLLLGAQASPDLGAQQKDEFLQAGLGTFVGGVFSGGLAASMHIKKKKGASSVIAASSDPELLKLLKREEEDFSRVLAELRNQGKNEHAESVGRGRQYAHDLRDQERGGSYDEQYSALRVSNEYPMRPVKSGFGETPRTLRIEEYTEEYRSYGPYLDYLYRQRAHYAAYVDTLAKAGAMNEVEMQKNLDINSYFHSLMVLASRDFNIRMGTEYPGALDGKVGYAWTTFTYNDVAVIDDHYAAPITPDYSLASG
ncbi:hypothetical protein ABT187_48230, partial [Streptomyces sp. NPDC001817]